MSIVYGPSFSLPVIEENGLQLWLDAGLSESYPGTGTTWYDLSGNNYDGTFYGSPTFLEANDGVIAFDADAVILPSTLGYTNAFSVFAWFKSTGDPIGAYHIICGGGYCEISVYTTGFLRTGLYTDAGRFVSNHGSDLTDGNYHYIGYTYDGTTKLSYINDKCVGTQSTTGTLYYAVTDRSIGRYGGSTAYYANGYIPAFFLYNRAVTPDEIAQNFYAMKRRYI